MRLWLISVVLLLCACGDKPLQALTGDDVILAFGDSLTAGMGVAEDKAYPAVLSELTGLAVVNAGISGETTAEGLARLPVALDEANPSLLILFEGGNDILRNQDLKKTKANLSAMIQMAKQQGVQVVLVGVPRKQLFSSTAQIYGELAKEHELMLQGDIVASLLRKPDMKSDSVHFNSKGYRAVAEAIAKMLHEGGALTENPL